MAYGLTGMTLDDGLWQPIASKRISFLLNHFHPQYSPEFYITLGSIYCEFMQDFEFGYELARLGIQIMEALDLKEINCRVSMGFNGVTRFYPGAAVGRHWIPCWKLIRWESRRENFFYAGRSALTRCQIAFMCGKELNWLKGELSALKAALKKIDYIIGSPHAEMLTKAVTILIEEPSTLSSSIMDQYHRVTGAEFVYRGQSSFNYQKLVLQTLFEEHEAARETVFEMINLMKTYKDLLIDPLANCYQSLALLALLRPRGLRGKRRRSSPRFMTIRIRWRNWRAVPRLIICINTTWWKPSGCGFWEGESDAILSHYDQAIALARESEFIHEEALANEMAARYLFNQGQNDDARSYLRLSNGAVRSLGGKTEGRASEVSISQPDCR